MFCPVAGGNHLSPLPARFRFILRFQIPLPNLSFSLKGFTAFHANRFRSAYVTVARYGRAPWIAL